MRRAVGDLLVQREEGHGRIQRLARLGAQSHDLQARGMYLLCQLVDGDVGRRADKDLPRVHFGKVVDDGRGSDRLSRPRRSLNEAKGLLENALDGIHLRMVKLREARR